MVSPETLIARWHAARAYRRPWESVWQECYDHILPRTPGAGGPALYDGTAADAAEQLTASLMAELTPPWARWFGLVPTRAQDTDQTLAPVLEQAAETLRHHIDHANFAVELHQAFLDLVVAGTGLLLVEENAPGAASALRFTAVPIADAVLEEGPSGRLDTVYRFVAMESTAFHARFPGAVEPKDDAAKFPVLEVVRADGTGYRYTALLIADESKPVVLEEGRFTESPFIAFRWMKAPGEVYGRSPVMTALPDIRTAQKVVELVLKNASIAVTGIWQADDDGVLNPANIQLVPGAIIPKAVGSQGLTPLAAPGKFDVSQLVLNDLRARIRHALLADRLSPVADARMTATEVMERSAEMARLLGATYGRLQGEFLAPLVGRCLAILHRRGEVPSLVLDGRKTRLVYQSPLAQLQARGDARGTIAWLQAVAALGPDALAQVDVTATTRFLARALGAPADLLIPNTTE